MNNELLPQIVRNNNLYVAWKTTPVTNANYEQIKLQFKNYGKNEAYYTGSKEIILLSNFLDL